MASDVTTLSAMDTQEMDDAFIDEERAAPIADGELAGRLPIRFETDLFAIDHWVILRLPTEASARLPTRAITMVEGTLNGVRFREALEPDGRGSHWFRVNDALLSDAHAQAGDTVQIAMWPTKDWVEPELPDDWQKALESDANARALWSDITPGARWDWIRWIRAVKTPETRQKHIRVALSKLNKGMRRPCCFNRNLCSEPLVAHNWVLRDPMAAHGSDE